MLFEQSTMRLLPVIRIRVDQVSLEEVVQIVADGVLEHVLAARMSDSTELAEVSLKQNGGGTAHYRFKSCTGR